MVNNCYSICRSCHPPENVCWYILNTYQGLVLVILRGCFYLIAIFTSEPDSHAKSNSTFIQFYIVIISCSCCKRHLVNAKKSEQRDRDVSFLRYVRQIDVFSDREESIADYSGCCSSSKAKNKYIRDKIYQHRSDKTDQNARKVHEFSCCTF